MSCLPMARQRDKHVPGQETQLAARTAQGGQPGNLPTPWFTLPGTTPPAQQAHSNQELLQNCPTSSWIRKTKSPTLWKPTKHQSQRPTIESRYWLFSQLAQSKLLLSKRLAPHTARGSQNFSGELGKLVPKLKEHWVILKPPYSRFTRHLSNTKALKSPAGKKLG